MSRPEIIVAGWAARMKAGETAQQIADAEGNGLSRDGVIGAVNRYRRRYGQATGRVADMLKAIRRVDDTPQSPPAGKSAILRPAVLLKPTTDPACMWDRILDGHTAEQIGAAIGMTADEVARAVSAYCRSNLPSPEAEPAPSLKIVAPPSPTVIRPVAAFPTANPHAGKTEPAASFEEAAWRNMCLFISADDAIPTCPALRRPGSTYCPEHFARCHPKKKTG